MARMIDDDERVVKKLVRSELAELHLSLSLQKQTTTFSGL
jgi:hypothetical protein